MLPEATEQVKGAGAPPADPQDAKKPSSVSEAFNMFEKKQSEKTKGKPVVDPSDEAKGKATDQTLPPKDDKKEKEPTPFPYRLVDEKGNEVPFPMTVDGEDIKETDLNKVLVWSQLGYHGNKRLEEVNLKEKDLEGREQGIVTRAKELDASQEMLSKIQGAIDSGRLVINPQGEVQPDPSKGEQIDEELYTEPVLVELKKENIQLKGDMKKLMEQQEATNKLLLGKLVEETKDVLDADIAKAKEKFPLLSEKEVWDLLAETEGGKPKYNVEDAAKLSHGNETTRFEKHIQTNPEFLKKDDEERKKIIATYLEEKKTAEAAPVAAPQAGAAQKPSTTPKGKREFKNMAEAADAANEWLQKRLAAKSKL